MITSLASAVLADARGKFTIIGPDDFWTSLARHWLPARSMSRSCNSRLGRRQGRFCVPEGVQVGGMCSSWHVTCTLPAAMLGISTWVRSPWCGEGYRGTSCM